MEVIGVAASAPWLIAYSRSTSGVLSYKELHKDVRAQIEQKADFDLFLSIINSLIQTHLGTDECPDELIPLINFSRITREAKSLIASAYEKAGLFSFN